MDIKNLLDELLVEVSLYHPIPDLSNQEHIQTLIRICEDKEYSEIATLLKEDFLDEADDNPIVKYTDEKGKARTIKYDSAIKYDKEHPAYKAAASMRGDVEKAKAEKENGKTAKKQPKPKQPTKEKPTEPETSEPTSEKPTDDAVQKKKKVKTSKQLAVDRFKDGAERVQDAEKAKGKPESESQDDEEPRKKLSPAKQKVVDKAVYNKKLSGDELQMIESDTDARKQYVEARMISYKEGYDSTPDSEKEQFLNNFLNQRASEVNSNYLRPAGTPASSFAENNGARLVNQMFNNPTEMSEDELVNELLKQPIAKEIEEVKDRERWARIAVRTAKTEAEVLATDPKYRAKKPQRNPYPKGVIMDGQSKDSIRTHLNHLLEKAREEGNTAAVNHYTKQIRYIDEIKETDTGVLYETQDGTIGFKHTSNKSGYKDPHNNTTPDQIVSDMTKRLEERGLVAEDSPVIKAQQTAIDDISTAEKMLTDGAPAWAQGRNVTPQENNRAAAGGAALFGKFPIGQGADKDYIAEAFKRKKNGEYSKEVTEAAEAAGISLPLNPKDPKSKEKQMKIVFELLKNPKASKGFVKKLVRKIGELHTALASCDSSKNPEQCKLKKKTEWAEYTGGNVKEIDEILKQTEGLADVGSNFKKSVAAAHEKIVSAYQDADTTHCAEKGEKCYPDDPAADNGPHQQAYVENFMHRMHFDAYVMGTRDGVSSQNIGGDDVSPEYYRECLAKLSGYDGDTDSENGRKGLVQYLTKRLRISPGGESVSIESKKEGEKPVTIGKDSYRTKGQSKGVLGGLGESMQECLEEKAKSKKKTEGIEEITSLPNEVKERLITRLKSESADTTLRSLDEMFNTIINRLLNEESTLSGYEADGEPPTGHLPDGKIRMINKNKPENWFKQLGYTQIDKPKADAMRGKGKNKDKDSQFRQISYHVQNIVQSTLNPAEKPKETKKWEKVKGDVAKQVRGKGETRFWDLEQTPEGKKEQEKAKKKADKQQKKKEKIASKIFKP